MRPWLRCAIALFCLARPGGSLLHAQVSLPSVQVPTLPQVGKVVDDAVNRTSDQLDPRVLRALRETRVRALIRENRQIIEADPQGAPILRGELVAIAPSESALARASASGFSVVRGSMLEALNVTVVVLRCPEGMSTRRALEQLRAADPEGLYDYNHLYLESGVAESVGRASSGAGAGSGAGADASAGAEVRVGLVDSGVDTTHPVFEGNTIIRQGCNGESVAGAHGTAVASLMVGEAKEFRGVAARATLYAADVYCGVPSGGSIDAILGALGWMARERVPVVNISIVGPPNLVLETVIRAMIARGHLLVAAVGNDGPAAKPLYPAAYAGVIGVTAVDARRRVLLEACRGPQVDFAAPGADIAAAGPDGALIAVRGTSYAAPIVSALLASRLSSPDGSAAVQAVDALASSATDLGRGGRDDTYGNGLVGDSLRAQLADGRGRLE
jgi:Subtilase family